jgi:(2Fe-2S) ferredoxin
MHKPKYHVLLCNSFRVSGEPQGFCNKKGSVDLLQYLQDEINDRGLDAVVSITNCLNVCEKGPVAVVYPNAWWFSEVNEEKIDAILEAMEQGEPAEKLLLA